MKDKPRTIKDKMSTTIKSQILEDFDISSQPYYTHIKKYNRLTQELREAVKS